MNQKLEDILNLALETPEEQRQQTETLNVGFDNEQRTWELLVKYHGSLEVLETIGVTVEYLIAGYAILTVPEGLVDTVAELEQIEYVEKPKRFFYSQVSPTGGRCFPPITMRTPFLTGEGVLLAVLDSGIDWTRRDFRKENGETRILYLWDQTLVAKSNELAEVQREGERDESMPQLRSERPPEGFSQGVEFDSGQINAALAAAVDSEAEGFALVPSRDVSGHGTAVAGIAAGYDPETGYRGAAPECSLLIVKLGNPGELGFPRTTEIMRGVTYALEKANELQMPLVINLSFGNSYGSHEPCN